MMRQNQEKFSSYVSNIFTDVSGKYDCMNNAMSFFMHHQWKKKFVNNIVSNWNEASFGQKNQTASILDVASGSGDIAVSLLKSMNCLMYVTDINEDMLNLARNRKELKQYKSSENVHFQIADGTNLPFADESFDIYTISFGIRNVKDIGLLLEEAYRVLKPNGKFYCMEFSHPNSPFVRLPYGLYLDHVIPKIGKYVANNAEAYEYLSSSIQNFLSPIEFKMYIEQAKFQSVEISKLINGIVTIHSGSK